MALLGKLDVNCLPPGKKPPAVRPERAVLSGAPRKAGERLGDDLFNWDGKTKTAESLTVPTGVSGQKSARPHLDEFGKSAFIQSAWSRAAYAKLEWFC